MSHNGTNRLKELFLMRKVRKLSFEELVRENREKLMNDQQFLDQLEEKWVQKRSSVTQEM